MKEIFVDAVYGKLEDDMPQLNISVNYNKNSRSYYLSCTPCQKTDTGMQFQFGLTHCSVDLEEVSRANKKIEEKWQLWAEDHKWGILKAFTEAGEACGATRKALRDYVDEWEGMKFDPSKAPNLNANDNKDDEEKSEYYPEYDLDLTPSEKAALDAGTKRFNFTTGELDDVEPQKKEAQITVKGEELQKALKELASIIPSKCSLPILENVLAEIKIGKLYLTSYDYSTGNDLCFTIDLDGESQGDEVSFLINASMARKMKFGKGLVSISAKENDSDMIDVEIGSTCFQSMKTGDFPKSHDFGNADDAEFLTFTLGDVHKNLGKCAANDVLRPVMNGICFDTDHKHMVASDGHVLRAIPTDFSECIGSFTVPTKAFNLMNGDVLMTYNKKEFSTHKEGLDIVNASYFIAQWDVNHRIVGRTLDSRYPNWKAVIPQKMPYRYQFAEPEQVMKAFRSICDAMECKKYVRPVRLRFTDGSDTADIRANDLDFNIKSYHKAKLTAPVQGNFEIAIAADLFRTVVGKDWDGTLYAQSPAHAAIMSSKVQGAVLLIMPTMFDTDEQFPYESNPVAGDFTTFEYKNYSEPEEPQLTEEPAATAEPEPTAEQPQPTEEPTATAEPETTADPITEPSDAEEVIQKAEENEPRPANYIPPFPQHIMWANEDKQQPDMVAAIYQYKEVVQHISEKDATIYYVIQPNEGNVLVCLETAIYMPAVDKMVVFSFYTGKALSSPTCKMTANDKVNIYTWEEGMNAIDVLHQVNKDVAM